MNDKILILVESPTKARKIASFLDDRYIIKATIGHIGDLAKTGKYNLGINLNTFKATYTLLPEKKSLIENIKKDIDRCKEIVLASDPDREGLAISMHLYDCLYQCDKPFRRIQMKSITKESILKAIDNAEDILSEKNINLFKSQEARRIIDRIVGFMVSPFLIEKHKQNLSAGRVQSVAVRMIVDRERDIDAFIPDEYWNVFAKFMLPNDKVLPTKLKNKLSNKDRTEALLKHLSKYKTYYVKSVISQTKNQKPPPPLTTLSLQRYMANKYNFSPERTMQVAQSLYETGYCSYIRTDSVRASPEDITSARKWLASNNLGVPETPNAFETKATAQDAHECIHPTNVSDIPKHNVSLSSDENTVYKAIWLHFVASQMKDSIWNTMTISISPKGDDSVVFVASGKSLEYKGYSELLNDGDNDSTILPNLQEGTDITLCENGIRKEQKKTQPPPRYTDASLLKELEAKQIGRPATFSDIFKKITNRNYIEKQGQSYKPTELGKMITNHLSNRFDFMEYKYSAEMEKKLDDIADGTLDQKVMLNEFFVPFNKCLDKAYIELGHKACDGCGSHMFERVNRASGSRFVICASCSNSKTLEKRAEQLNG